MAAKKQTLNSTGDSIKIDIPLKGETDWAEILKTAFQKITDHTHEGTGNGKLIQTNGIEPNAINSSLILADAVITSKILDLNVTAAKLSTDAVETVKIKDLNVTEDKLAANAVSTAKILDDNITVAKKKTTELTGMSDPQALSTGLTSDKSFIIHYRIKDGSNYQIGTLSGVSNSCLVDEFVGADLGFTFDYTGNDIEINGASGKDLQYSIEFLE